MQRYRNISKGFSLIRCPTQAFGNKLPGNNAVFYTHAHLPNSYRKLYTELAKSGCQLADVRKALISRQHKIDMNWVKLTCSLKHGISGYPCSVPDYLSMPLKRCCDLKPCHIGSVKYNNCQVFSPMG